MKIKINHNIRQDFPWFRKNQGWVYLDSSATTLKPRCVINSIVDYYEKWSTNPHNNDSKLTYYVSQLIDNTRSKLALLINAHKQEIIFTSGATESLNLVARGLTKQIKSDDEIIVTYGEHTSNLLPWISLAKTKHCKLIYAGSIDKNLNEQDIINKVTKKTKIIAFANISNLIGYELDAQIISQKAKKINPHVLIVCDATQMLPHKLIDVKKSNIDFLVASAHKMCGATGIGMLYMKTQYFHQLDPLRLGGGMNNNVMYDSFTYASGPAKFEGGSPHTAGIISWATAIDYLNAYGWKNIHQYELKLKQYANQKLQLLKNVQLINPLAQYPIVAFNVNGMHPQDVANYLGHKKIIVRSGLSCAKLIGKIINQSGVVRASFYIYNNFHDIDVLVKALKNLKKGNMLKHVI
ncbi:MAG: aminotransferase class V-fold PLP-dependent enzyme [Mycoplasmataceae bacterium]|nr:aminotransferase class V-fold PLP-dependent enzyme [Mycoplasmataceae bacterium]